MGRTSAILLAATTAACTSGPERPEQTAAVEPVVAVTFNTGTSEEMGHDQPPDDGYTSVEAARSDAWYGDGLAWLPAVEATTAFLTGLQPDIVAFQEIFWSGDCPSIPEAEHTDFVCERWAPGDPTVAQEVLGAGYQVACNLGKPDKCLGIRRAFGTIRGCDADLCLDGLDGGQVEGCGSGSRIGRATVDRADGSVLVVVGVHGSSGVSAEDMDCRARQVDQVFVDLGDGEPGANGEQNLVLGDLNTDPGRWASFDPSAARWNEHVDGDFAWITEIGEDAPRTYQGLATIDHVVSDSFEGSCRHPGLGDEPRVLDAVYFDHLPAICTLTPR